jgi:adenine phosphoribosyltransferase
MDLKSHIRGIPDFPIPGILFYDISTILSNPSALEYAVTAMEEKISAWQPDIIAGIESRGFLFATPLAMRMGLPMMMIRKAGKLPGEVVSYEYDLEYGTDTIQIQADAIKAGQKVVIIDDLLATGGTLSASVRLCQQVGGEVVGCGVVIELDFLSGTDALEVPCISLVNYSI